MINWQAAGIKNITPENPQQTYLLKLISNYYNTNVLVYIFVVIPKIEKRRRKEFAPISHCCIFGSNVLISCSGNVVNRKADM